MAKRLICSILVDVLGTYVEGLSAENLNLGVLSGKVEMNNLQLKKSGLDGLDLPITIEHGSLKKLRLKIPWTALDSKPVRVYLDGVYLQAGPLDVGSLSPEDLARMNIAQRRQKLKAAEDTVFNASKTKDAESSKEKAQELSYFQQFGLKIVDNIEIVLTNVHIRYEDSTTFPGKTFSAGVTIDSISLVTTDSNWNEAFVARDFTAAAIQKLGRLENLGLYWNTDCDPLAPLNNAAWEESMQEMIFKSSWDNRRASMPDYPGYGQQHMQHHQQKSPRDHGLMYLLGVPNSLYVKITHTEACTETTPKINIDIEISSLALEIDKLQYQQLMATIASFGSLDRQKQLAMMRPSKRPTVCPRDWWFYAYKLVTGKDISSGGPFEVIVKCMRFRRRYMDLVKLSRLASGGVGGGADPPPNVVFGPREEYELARIEELVPLCALLVFRQLAMAELVQEEKWRVEREAHKKDKKQKNNPVARFFAKRKKAEKEKEKAVGGGARFDRWSRQEDEEDEMIMDIIQSKLSVNVPSAGDNGGSGDDEQFILRLSVLNSATLRLTNDRTPTALLELALAFRMELHTSVMVLSFVLEDFQVLDECTENPLNPFLIVARRDVPTHRHYSSSSLGGGGKNDSSHSPEKLRSSPRISDTPDEKLSVVIENIAGKSSLRITAQPIEITWNELCVQRILAIFMPTGGGGGGVSPVLLSTMNKIAMDAAVPVAGDMEMIIEIDAPKIVIPDDCHSDKGCLLIDGGFLVVKGSIGEVNLVFDISLTAVNVGMPHSLEERYKQNVYLVKPFDIKLNIQNIDKSVADQTLVLDISPSLSADLDSEKIRRLINLIMVIVNTCTKAFDQAAKSDDDDNDDEDDDDGLLGGRGNSTGAHNHYLTHHNNHNDNDTLENMSVIDAMTSPVHRIVNTTTAAADKRLFDMSLFLTSISVHLQLSERHSVQLLISSLGAHIVNHLHDSEIIFSVGSLKLVDSMRHREQADIIWTPAAALEDDHSYTTTRGKNTKNKNNSKAAAPTSALVKVTYIVISNRQSPLYRNHGTELRVEFDRLGLNIDDQGVLRLKPFFESLGAALADVSGGGGGGGVAGNKSESPATGTASASPQEKPPQLQTPTQMTRQNRVASELTAMDVSSVVKATNAPVGMCMSFTVGAISLTLMRRNKMFSTVKLDDSQVQVSPSSSPSRHSSHWSRGGGGGGGQSSALSPGRDRRGTSVYSNSNTNNSNNISSSNILRTPKKGGRGGGGGYNYDTTTAAVAADYPPLTSPRGSSSLPPIAEAAGEWLESAFTVEVNGFSCDIDIKELVTTDVRLKLFNIRDSREASKTYEYREMITRSTLASEHNSNATGEGGAGEDNISSNGGGGRRGSRGGGGGGGNRGISGANTQNLTAEEVNELATGADGIGRAQDLLTVIYREESKGNGAVDIVLRDIAAFISIDAVIEVVDVVMDMVNAILGVIAALYTPSPSSSSLTGEDTDADDAPRTSSGGRIRREKPSFHRGGAGGLMLTDGGNGAAGGGNGSEASSPDVVVGGYRRTGLRSREMNSRTKNAIAKRATGAATAATGGVNHHSYSSSSSRYPYKKQYQPAGVKGDDQQHQLQQQGKVKPKVVVQEAAAKQPSCINVVVSVVNPRILLLEDPENANSRAIIARTSASVHYCNDITKEETRETIHVSLQPLEIFALTGLLEGRPQQIVEPFGVMVHVSRRIIEEFVISTSISADIDVILAKVSIKDIALAQSIASRANIAATKKEQSSAPPSAPPVSQPDMQSRYQNKNKGNHNTNKGTPDRSTGKPKNEKSAAQQDPSLRTVYDLVVQLGKVSVTAMNDYEGLSVPVVRAQIEHTNFRLNGLLALGDFKGDGSLTISADFYNTRVAAWEPVIERWNPTLAMNSDSCKGTVIAICNDSTLQCNVAGSMVRGLTHYINILVSLFDPTVDKVHDGHNATAAAAAAKADDELVGGVLISSNSNNHSNNSNNNSSSVKAKAARKEVDSPIMFSNQLEFPVTIFDSITGGKLVDVGAGDTMPLELPGATARSWIQSQASLPTYFDVKVLGKLRDERLPLVQLPLNISRPRPYYLQPTVGLNKTRNIGIEPIVEEAYENQRFDLTKWGKPWTHMGDPPEWTDATGLIRRDLDSIKLPNDKWMWIESGWKVDRTGIVGREIDEDGWEYATNFTSFNVSKKRRVKQPMDVARRRRWYRTRAPKSSHLDDVTRPLTIIWDVKTRKNGSRLATIRSGLEVINIMPFPISVSVFGLPSEGGHSDGAATKTDKGRASLRSSDNIQVFEKIQENQTFYVPLMLSHASFMKVRPSRPGFDWSQPISCRGNISLSNATATTGGGASFSSSSSSFSPGGAVSEVGRDGAKLSVENLNGGIVVGTYSLMCESDDENDIYIRAILNQAEKSRSVLLAPHVFLRNHLPCNMGYNCVCDDGRIENGVLRAGATAKLAFVHLSSRLLVSIKVHGYAWSTGTVVDCLRGGGAAGQQSTETVDLQVIADDEVVQASAPVGMSLMMHTTFNEHGAIDIRFFSRFALLDKTGLQLSVRTKRGVVNPDGSMIEKMLESSDFGSSILIDRRTFNKWEEPLRQQALVNNFTQGDTGTADSGLGGTDVEEVARNCWAVGANGMVLFHSEDNKASIGVHRGAAWCENLSLVSFGAAKAPFEVTDTTKNVAYQLAYFTTQLPGVFNSTQVVTIIPAYCIVNCLDEPIELKQVLVNNTPAAVMPPGLLTAQQQQKFVMATAMSSPALTINAKSSKGWHKVDATRGTTVQLRCMSSGWSVGTIDVNEIGSTVMILPKRYAGNTADTAAAPSSKAGDAVDPFKSSTAAVNGVSVGGKDKDKRGDADKLGSSASPDEDFIVVHVEVRFASYSDLSYVNVVIWREQTDKDGNCHGAALSVRNDTTLPIKVHQAGMDYSMSHTDSSLFEVTVQPSTWVPFGWADQSVSSLLSVRIGGNIGAVPLADAQGSVPPCTVDMSTIGEVGSLKLTRPAGTGKGSTPYDTIQLTVEAVGGGRVLRATKHLSPAGRSALGSQGKANLALIETAAREVEDALSSPRTDTDIVAPADYRDFVFNLHIKSIGISLIAERPIRREFLSAYIDGIDLRLWRRMDNRQVKDFTTSFEFTVSDMQVDNYSDTVVRPVILHSYSSSRREVKRLARQRKNRAQDLQSNLAFPEDNEDPTTSNGSTTGTGVGVGDASNLPFIIFSAVQELPRGSTTPIYKYVALRILEIKLAVDSATLQLYYCDLHGDLIGEVRGRNLAESAPEIWVTSYNKKIVTDQLRLRDKPGVDLAVALKSAQESKMYFETLILHPIKIRLSFVPTQYPRRQQQQDSLSVEEARIFKIIHNVTAIDELAIKIKSFIVNNAMESAETLGNRILVKVVRDLLIHLVEIAGKVFGSLEAVGKPAGLYRNIGDGVKDFFYEPYEGMMHSPKGFLKGLGRGTGSLFSGVARGAIISTAAIVSSASKGVAVSVGAVSGDQDFLRSREEQRRLTGASGGGVIAGVRAGGESVLAGFTSGISGLVTKPIEEGRKSGALGVIKGIGLGFAGALTKPVLGVTEGIASVAHGVTNQIADVIIISNIRPRRAFERSDTEQTDLVLVPLDLAAAKAQEFVNRAGLKGRYNDIFIAHIAVDGSMYGAFAQSINPVTTVGGKGGGGQTAISSSETGKKEGEEEAYVVASVVISEMYVFLLRKDASLHARYSFGVISHCILNADSLVVELVLYQDFVHGAPVTGQGMTEELLISVRCRNIAAMSKLYSALAACALRMGNPSGVIPMNVALSSKGRNDVSSNAFDDPAYEYNSHKRTTGGRQGGGNSIPPHYSSSNKESSTSGRVPVVIDGYRFGTANSMTFPAVTLTEKDVLRRAELRFTDVSSPAPERDTPADREEGKKEKEKEKDRERGRNEKAIIGTRNGAASAGASASATAAKATAISATSLAVISRMLDERLWQTIVEWRINHKKLTHSRCCATLVFNRSESPVQILQVDVLDGRNVSIFGVNPGTGGYDVDSRTIMSGGGAAVIFAYGFLPTPIDPAHVRVRIVTSAFSAVVSTRANRTTCEPVGGYTAGYLEKSLTENWAKYAILVL